MILNCISNVSIRQKNPLKDGMFYEIGKLDRVWSLIAGATLYIDNYKLDIRNIEIIRSNLISYSIYICQSCAPVIGRWRWGVLRKSGIVQENPSRWVDLRNLRSGRPCQLDAASVKLNTSVTPTGRLRRGIWLIFQCRSTKKTKQLNWTASLVGISVDLNGA